MMILLLLAMLSAQTADEAPEIVSEALPSVEELGFEKLTGDFDGDGEEDEAAAHQTGSGVQMTLRLSSLEEPLVHDLGVDTLEGLSWAVVEVEAPFCAEEDPSLCPPKVDMIEITPRDGEPFLLAWDGEALETLFPDS
ncbi:hypothetical protein [Parvularcula maris]|uniref:Uncharacterized protein n=1 Tax=Parvularcula maris TaxID=2965077 RepID=A0A9X2L8D2_9PROT|nr:hypothetical protein [Parvularcula maris]MCQ8184042.1 hypothetical protein [Parvularcula maris]